MLNLIYGPSRSGKSSVLTERIRLDIRNKTRCYLLVPEQEAYIRERNLAAILPENAGMYFEVVHFSGLCDEMFHRYGGATSASADGSARSLLMWDTLRTLAPILHRYGSSARSDTGLVSGMLSAIDELKNNGITSDQLETVVEQLPEEAPLRKKLSDLALILASYQGKMEDAFGGTAADRLQRMAEALRAHAFFSGTHIYVDSFTSFTVPEYAVLEELLRQAESVTVALCADGPDTSKMHFREIRETEKRFFRLAKKAGVPVTQKTLPVPGGARPMALRILEKDLWNFDLSGQDRIVLPDHGEETVHLLTCPNLYEESEAVAWNILGLTQSGMHYGDIAVIVRDTETYRGVLDAALERHGIPYFLSERTDLSSKPLARLILSALRSVSRNYPSQDVITMVKTGLCGVDAREASLFEEYCETWHISGSQFCDEVWNMNPDGLTDRRSPRSDEIIQVANRVRATVMNPLQRLNANLRSSDLLQDRCAAVYEYLVQLNIAEKLSMRAEEELALGQSRDAGETVRLYRFITETLVRLCDLLPDSRVSVDELLSMLTILFSESDLGSVPNLHDCVIIGSAATVRVENVRASFLLGLCEGEFPRAVEDDGLLTDGDKLALEEYGITFDGNLPLRSSQELFYVYRAIAKPKEQLFLSYPSAQTDGSACSPSLAFSRICYLLDRSAEVFRSDSINPAQEAEPAAIYPFRTTPYPPGTELYLSSSSVRQFSLCPYQYYVTHRLRLRERKDAIPSYADDGKFLHYIFEQFLRSCVTGDGRLTVPGGDTLSQAIDETVSRYLNAVCPIPAEELDSRLLHLFARLREQARMMIRIILLELEASRFRPVAFEQSIGGKNPGDLPAIVFTLTDGSSVRLGGTIDRLDVFQEGDTVYLRVVDYKSGTHKFDLHDIETGMDIQLILYLFAATNADVWKTHVVPGGAEFYYAARKDGELKIDRSGFVNSDSAILAAADATEGQVYLKHLIRQTEEEIRQMVDGMQNTVRTVAGRILSGEADKTPSEDACNLCPIRTNCDVAAKSRNGY